ncbi:hypothetical protein [Dyadobacter fermentans]|uniref:Outer membrane protein beta-barrel domain-containing protein n=1 Tax=Dyadobacter fermentans (strain ATCC 700827 / DSM 18053 / CIP 107007 / KCTC 52180 / NS114) TaxID=471854 RepID=C6VZ20_DYAFD|nr:hypothetical protein [Dyadobacter fermentans]ACT95226.1 hypothetical protein Dfer_4022 [Dyadobacter fermentans DSM 18053]
MRYILLILSCVVTSLLSAQTPRYRSSNGISQKKSYDRSGPRAYFLTARCGLSQFYGELNGQAMHGIGGMSFGKWVNKQVALQLDYHAGTLGGEKRAFFNSYFINEYNSVECIVKWDLSEQFSSLEPGPAHIIVYGGLGQIWFSAQAFDLDDGRLLRFTNSSESARNPLFLRWGPPKGPRGIKKTREGILPLGTSVDYALLKNLKIALDYRLYFVRTDKLDATSGQRLINPEESESYSNTPNDMFSFISVSLDFRFGQHRK